MGVEVAYITHPACLDHLAGSGHPERPERLGAVEAGLRASGLPYRALTAEAVPRAWIEAVHDIDYLDAIRDFSRDGGGIVDWDTWVDAHTWEAAQMACGAGAVALEAGAELAVLGIRPPGHHALRARAMGFCYLNNVAVAAAHVRQQNKKVAIVDWDVHHGNGTQAMLEDDPGTLYISLHQSPFYPSTGKVDETGAAGSVANIPLPPGTGGDVYREAFHRLITPIIRQFAPDHLFISAGFDAHQDDPLAEINLASSDYGFMARDLREAAPNAPIIAFLEGGYDLAAIETSVTAMVRGFAGDTQGSWTTSYTSPPEALRILERAEATLSTFWRL